YGITAEKVRLDRGVENLYTLLKDTDSSARSVFDPVRKAANNNPAGPLMRCITLVEDVVIATRGKWMTWMTIPFEPTFIHDNSDPTLCGESVYMKLLNNEFFSAATNPSKLLDKKSKLVSPTMANVWSSPSHLVARGYFDSVRVEMLKNYGIDLARQPEPALPPDFTPPTQFGLLLQRP
ncbi:hypothetical protein DXG01_005307, partial [Tephrocybe rancida]